MAVHVDWWVEYSDHSKPVSPSRAAVSTFSFTDHQIFGIAPITEVLNSSHFRVLKLKMRVFRNVTPDPRVPQSNMIINTAILTNQPASLAVMVLAISRDEKVYDVTSAATCYSADENTVKVWILQKETTVFFF